jgi:predicted amidophosphoribosyltransferase
VPGPDLGKEPHHKPEGKGCYCPYCQKEVEEESPMCIFCGKELPHEHEH